MARDPVPGRTQQYKIGETTLITWLVDRIEAFADVNDVLGRRKPEGDDENNKKKNKKRSKRLVVNSRELMKLATRVVERAQETGEEPHGLRDTITVLEVDILNRRDSSKSFQVAETTKDKESNRGHKYFVDILAAILDSFKYVSKRTSQMEEPATNTPTDSAKTNAFATLPHYDPSDVISGVSQSDESRPNSKTTYSTVSLQLEKDYLDEQRNYALWSFFRDFKTGRRRIKETWTAWELGEISDENAALVTQSFLLISSASSNDLVGEFPECATFGGVAKILGLETSLQTDAMKKQISQPNTGLGGNDEAILSSDTLCTQAWFMLQLLQAHNDQKLRSAHGLKKDKVEASLKSHAASRVILELSSIIEQLAKFGRDGRWAKSLDVFTEELLALSSTGNITLTAVMSFQVHIDIFNIIGDSHKYLNPRQLWLRSESAPLKSTLERGKTAPIVGDCFVETAQKVSGHWEAPKRNDKNLYAAEDKAMALACRLPILAGMYAWSVTELRHRRGLALCESGRVAVTMAHLYSFLKLCSRIYGTGSWTDMEKFIEIFGMAALGLRDNAPSDKPLKGVARDYALAMGASVTNLPTGAKLGRVHLPSQLSSKAVRLELASSFLKHAGDERPDPTNISRILHKVAGDSIPRPNGTVSAEVQEHWSKKHQLDTVTLIDLLEYSLQKEEAAVHFNYEMFFVDCCSEVMNAQKFSSVIGNATFHQPINDILWKAAEREQYVAGMLNGKVFEKWDVNLRIVENMNRCSEQGQFVLRLTKGRRKRVEGAQVATEDSKTTSPAM